MERIKNAELLTAMTRMALLTILVAFILGSCQKNDDVAPVMTLNGADTIFHVLNEEYNDPGVSAIDESEGDITDKVFVDNQVDIDRMGEYMVNYSVVDEAGNEAPPLSRVVVVYNQGVEFAGEYSTNEHQVFPGQDTCFYPTFLWVDSTHNWRLVFIDFACNSQRQVFADVQDTVIIVPFQVIQDSVVSMTLQGSGSISDTLISLEYSRTEEAMTSYWRSDFIRLK